MIKGNKNSSNFYLLVLTVFAIFFIFSDLGVKKLPPIDDCYYSQMAKEIIQTGDWLTMHYAGEAKIDLAPFHVWLIAIMFKLFGISEFSARFFSAFFGVATIISVYYLGKKLFDGWVGLFSSFVMLTTQLFFIYSRRVMTDVTITFLITFALIFFIEGVRKRKYLLLFGLSSGIAILTKSLFGFFPILIAIVYLLFLREFKKIIDPFFLLGITIAVIVSFPWYLYQFNNYPELFVGGHLKWVIYDRVFKSDNIKTVGTPLWYLKILWIFYWPWIPLATYSFLRFLIKNIQKIDSNTLFILLWVVAVIGVMSFMSEKKAYYIISAFPPLAILTGISLNCLLIKEKRKILFVGVCFVLLLLTTIVIITTPISLPFSLREEEEKYYIVDETWSIAMFAKENIPKNEKIVLYRIWLWRLRSAYLFYSDRDISTSIYDRNLLIKILKDGTARYCLTTREGFSELSAIKDLRPKVLKETPSLIFFRAM